MKRGLKNRHHLIAALAAGGTANTAIARALQSSPAAIGQVLKDREVAELVIQLREQHLHGGIRDLISHLMGAAVPSARVLEEIRDTDPDNRNRRNAAKDLIQFATDWTKPAVYRDGKQEEHGAAISREDLLGIATIAKEAGEVMDAEFTVMQPQSGESAPLALPLPPRAPMPSPVYTIDEMTELEDGMDDRKWVESAVV